MNKNQLAAAYAELVKRYDLRHRQRDVLDSHDYYVEILTLVYLQKWVDVDELVQRFNYFNPPDDGDPKFELVG